MPEPALAFLSQSKLHVRRDGTTRMVESEFERTVRERAASIERRHAWKSQGRGAAFMSGFGGQMPPGPNDVPVLMTGLTAARDGSLVYSMETDAVSGVFTRDAEGVETRLFHTADFRIRQTALHPDGSMLAAAAFHGDSVSSHIAVMGVPGNDLREITEGDSFEQFPRWVPGKARELVFQCSGIGRDAAGRFVELGPCGIQKMDLDSGELEEVLVSGTKDHLQPRITADGTLYCIRKPYTRSVVTPTLSQSLKDAVLFPFRMGQAIFQYLNVFSMLYSGKPLVTSKGAVERRVDPRQLFLYGNLARASMMPGYSNEDRSLAPSAWELIRRAPGGQVETVASHVLAYDVAADGTLVFTDGSTITSLRPGGRAEQVFQSEQVDQLLLLTHV